MLKKHCILLWLSFQLLVVINCQTILFKPKQRYLHTSTLIDDKLYILGGTEFISNVSDALPGKEFFYLDVSALFNTQKLLWQDLSSINTVSDHSEAASVKGGANNNTLFLYVVNDVTVASVYTFNPQSNSWSVPKIIGVETFRKFDLTGIVDDKRKMYLWGGTDIISGTLVNDMLILDTINLNWGKGSLVNAPSPRVCYGAVLLPNNNIIYMGKQVILVP